MRFLSLWKTYPAKSFFVRNFSSAVSGFWLECLKNRTLLRISGNEVEGYMQGLITNDMGHFSGGAPCLYAFFLTSKGRVLYDSIIYKCEDKQTYFIECDIAASNSLKKHLEMYRVRRKLQIDTLENIFHVWVLCRKESLQPESCKTDCKATVLSLKNSLTDCLICTDPRIANLGIRIVASSDINLLERVRKTLGCDVETENFYKELRYKLGVGEGVSELPPERCFPLEANCDYLHGISFHKGCYIGQELTARTYHTGVIRKRLMPLSFEESVRFTESDVPVLADGFEKPIGKLKGAEKRVGIGLLRIEEALNSSTLNILGKASRTNRPFWWPTELSKGDVRIK